MRPGKAPAAAEIFSQIDSRIEELFEAYALHLNVSAGAGALAAILLGVLSGDEEPTDLDHATVARVFAGASDVESADIAEGSERLLEALVASPDRPKGFERASVEEAVTWLESDASGEPGRLYRDYIRRHAHRSLRELDLRQPEWGHDPTPLVRSLQTQLRGRLSQSTAADPAVAARPSPEPGGTREPAADPVAARAARFRLLSGVAHAAVRNRERAKSLLVELTAMFKQAYRTLADSIVSEGLLPDADAVYFLFHEELGRLTRGEEKQELAEHALARRESLAYQETLVFPEVSTRWPEPEAPGAGWAQDSSQDPDLIVGKPVSSGCVEGRVRVVAQLDEAEALEPGEILVAPITDVGWTPYFSIIAGLVTDVGSAVSHGAVVAREFGLPAVLNTRVGTQALRTGDLVRLDGDRGLVERLASVAAEGETAVAGTQPECADGKGRFSLALAAFDALNRQDPTQVEFDGEIVPRCLLDAQRASFWIEKLDADASEALRLAARAHHLGRFRHPRSEFPDGRAGYHAWRRALQKRHAAAAQEILLDVGYSEEEGMRVGELICKRGLGRDPEVQSLEDALCLVFLETTLGSFSKKHTPEKVVQILVKSLAKMSDAGRAAAGEIVFEDREAELVAEALRVFENEGNAS